MRLAALSCKPWIVPSGRMVLVVIAEAVVVVKPDAPRRSAAVRLALVSVAPLRLALVRFCPAKFQPVKLLSPSPMPWRSLAW